ncbi:MAG: hypothetical protein ABIL09_02605 [Gemmatimonadota bacterium]
MRGPRWLRSRPGGGRARLGRWALAGLALLVVPGGLILLLVLVWRRARPRP